MSRYIDNNERLCKMIEDLNKKVENQQTEIELLKVYQHKIEDYFSIFQEKKRIGIIQNF